MLESRIAELERQVAEMSRVLERLSAPRALYLPPFAKVGEGVKIDPTVTLWCSEDKPIVIGDGARIYRGAELLGPVTIGNGGMINRDAYIRPQTTIGDRVFFGPFVRVLTDGHEVGAESQRAGRNMVRPTSIGDGTWVGGGAIILGGVTIGAGCIVAAGSVVVKDVPDNTLVAGVPARFVRTLG